MSQNYKLLIKLVHSILFQLSHRIEIFGINNEKSDRFNIIILRTNKQNAKLKLIILLLVVMRDPRLKQELIYFPKNIRKNILPVERPKTTPHRRYFTSRGFRQLPDGKSEVLNALATLQINNTIYANNGESPKKKNTRNFLEACRIDTCKQNKIKHNTIQGKINLQDQNNKMQEFVDALIDSNFFFQKLEKTMVQSLCLIGIQKKYMKGQKPEPMNKSIGFVLYGRMKIFDKDYSFLANRGDTIGQHELFSSAKTFKLKALDDCAILWISIQNYNILRQETVKQGFRHQFNRIQTQLRLSFIKKKMPKQ